MVYKRILYDKIEEGKIVKITMNRPEKRNATDPLMLDEIENAFLEADFDDDVRVIILAGAGRDFCAGIDVSPEGQLKAESFRAKKAGDINREGTGGVKNWDYGLSHQMMTIRNVSKPTIGMVQHNIAGLGWFMVSQCDLIVASEDARFIDPLTRYSLAGMHLFVQPYDVGFRRAKWMIWSNEPLSAQDAKQIGLVLQVVPLEKLEEATLEIARKITNCPPTCAVFAKQSVNFALDEMGQHNSFAYHRLAHCFQSKLKGERPMAEDKPKPGTF